MSTSEERPAAPASPHAGSTRNAESLEQVRDLLFGSEMRALDRRVQRVEERVAREMTALRSDLKLRLESLQNDLSREVDGLTRALGEERAERQELVDKMTARIEAVGEAIEARLEELRGEAAAAHDELRVSALEDGQAIRAESAAARQEDHKRLARMFAQLARFMDEATPASGPDGTR